MARWSISVKFQRCQCCHVINYKLYTFGRQRKDQAHDAFKKHKKKTHSPMCIFATGMVPVLHQMAQFHQHVSVDVGTFNFQPTLQGRNTINYHILALGVRPENQHGRLKTVVFFRCFPFSKQEFCLVLCCCFFFREGIPPNTNIPRSLGLQAFD